MNDEILVTVQRRVRSAGVPAAASLRAWANAAMGCQSAALTIRIVDEPESAALNQRYRNKAGPTNVLSFNYDGLPVDKALHGNPPMLGDLVICKPVVLREAREQGIPARAHWAHMIVHGVLHLRGMDHEQPIDATRMEQREKQILGRLGFDDPYRSEALPAGPIHA